MRVVVANEPRAYREVAAEVLSKLRLEVEFLLVDPRDLEETVARLHPDMVVCDEASPVVRASVPVWLELYPGGSDRSVVSVRGRRSTIESIQLSDILLLVDQTVARKA
jgi:hypothetical protein